MIIQLKQAIIAIYNEHETVNGETLQTKCVIIIINRQTVKSSF